LSRHTRRQRRDNYIFVPDWEQGISALRFLGLDEFTARDVWETWLTYNVGAYTAPNGHGHRNFHIEPLWRRYLISVTKYKESAESNSDDWSSLLKRWGISQELQDAILDPDFEDVRSTKSLYFWLDESFATRRNALDDIMEASRARSRMFMVGHRNHLAVSRGVARPQHSMSTIETTTPSETSTQYIYLWRTCNQFQEEDIQEIDTWNNVLRAFVSVTGHVNWDMVRKGSVFLYSSRTLAERYAAYANARSNGLCRKGLLRIKVPVNLLTRIPS